MIVLVAKQYIVDRIERVRRLFLSPHVQRFVSLTRHADTKVKSQEVKMVLPYHLCSHIQNSFRARHKHITVPHTTQNLGILSILLRAGFISSITRGTVSAPSPDQFNQVTDAQKRIWAELKYREDRPVLSNMEIISKPSKNVFVTWSELLRICSGRRANQVKPLGMGEIAIVKTADKEHEWLEAREALQLKLDGEVICRVR